MKEVQVFDPALCCSSGVCGTDVDQKLVDFSADVDWAKQNGAVIERFNLAQTDRKFNRIGPSMASVWRANPLFYCQNLRV